MDWYQVVTLIVIPILSVIGAGGLIQAILNRKWAEKDKKEEAKKQEKEEKEKENKEKDEQVRQAEIRKIFVEETEHIKESLKVQDKKIETLLDADKKHSASLVSVLRDRLYQLNRYCIKKGFTTQDERANFEEMFLSYTSLGGNGLMVSTHKKFLEIPSQEEYERQKKSKGI